MGQAMGDSLLAYWRDRHGYQSFLYAIGALFAISAAVHSIAFFIYGGPVGGACVVAEADRLQRLLLPSYFLHSHG